MGLSGDGLAQRFGVATRATTRVKLLPARDRTRPNSHEIAVANDLVAAVAEPRKLTAEQYAEAITASWQQAVHSIIRTGRLLIEAKKALRHGEFGQMIDSTLPFSASTAQRLMKIAEHPILSNAAHVQHLPPSWGTLYELTKVPQEALASMLGDGRINAGTERKQVDEILAKIREDKIQRIVDALNTLGEFRAKGDSAKLARNLMDAEGHPSLDDLKQVAHWIEGLFVEDCEAAEAEQADRKARSC